MILAELTDFSIFLKCHGEELIIRRKSFHVGDTLTVLVKDIHDTKGCLKFEVPGDKPCGRMLQRTLQ